MAVCAASQAVECRCFALWRVPSASRPRPVLRLPPERIGGSLLLSRLRLPSLLLLLSLILLLRAMMQLKLRGG